MMSPRFRFEFIGAPADVAPYVKTLFVLESDEARLEDGLPAYSAQMIAFGQGEARMEFSAHHSDISSGAFFLAPMLRAARFEMAGPVSACGISLTTLGWAAIAGLPVDQFGHRKFEARDILGTESALTMAQTGKDFAAGQLDAKSACMALVDVLRAGLAPPRAEHARFIACTTEWLNSAFNPPFSGLVERCGLSPRQIQRLTKRYFGKPPTGLIRRYRAIRAATLLSQPSLPPELHNEVLDAFFDQAHLIRDIRHFTGRTPTGLGGAGDTVTADTLGPEGYGPIDLFGGSQTPLQHDSSPSG